MPKKVYLKTRKSKRDLTRYAGQWVAFIGEKVVGHERTLPKLMTRVRKKYPKKEPAVFLVPRRDEGPYILIIL